MKKPNAAALVRMETENINAAVAGQLAHIARQRGGVLMGTADELQKLGSGELWPRSGLELEQVVLPALARRGSHPGCTVRPVGGVARGVWHVLAAPLPQAAPRPLPRPVAPPALQPRPVAAAAPVTAAEAARVRSLATAERNRQERERHARAVQAEREREHAANLAVLATASRRAAA